MDKRNQKIKPELECESTIYKLSYLDTLPTAKAGGFYTARNAGLRACLTSIVAIGVCAQTPPATRFKPRFAR